MRMSNVIMDDDRDLVAFNAWQREERIRVKLGLGLAREVKL